MDLNDTPDSLSTSATLLDALRDPGNAAAVVRFHKRYEPFIRGCCARVLRNPPPAFPVEDAVQVALAHLLVELRHFTYDANRRFRSWLGTVVTRVVLSALRSPAYRSFGGELHEPSVADLEADAGFRRVAEIELYERAASRVYRRLQNRGEPTTWEAYRLTAARSLGGEELTPVEAGARLGLDRHQIDRLTSRVRSYLRGEVKLLDPPE